MLGLARQLALPLHPDPVPDPLMTINWEPPVHQLGAPCASTGSLLCINWEPPVHQYHNALRNSTVQPNPDVNRTLGPCPWGTCKSRCMWGTGFTTCGLQVSPHVGCRSRHTEGATHLTRCLPRRCPCAPALPVGMFLPLLELTPLLCPWECPC